MILLEYIGIQVKKKTLMLSRISLAQVFLNLPKMLRIVSGLPDRTLFLKMALNEMLRHFDPAKIDWNGFFVVVISSVSQITQLTFVQSQQ